MLQFYNHLLDLMSDFLFINDTCLANASDTQLIELYDKLNQTPSLYFHLFIIAPFPLAIIGFITNFLFIYQAWHGIRTCVLPKRLYLFLINRAIGDGLASFTSILLCIYGFVSGKHIPNAGLINLSETIFWITYWAAVVSYMSLGLIKLLAVTRILLYRRLVTTRRCIYLLAFSWLVAFGVGCFVLVTMFSLVEGIGFCAYDTCGYVIVQVFAIFEFVSYFALLACFALVYILVYRAQNSAFRQNSSSVIFVTTKQRRSTISGGIGHWRLSISVIVFGVLYLFPTLVGVYVAFVYKHCYYTTHWYDVLVISGAMRIVMLFRILFDPIVNYLIDSKLRKLSIFSHSINRNISATIDDADKRNDRRKRIQFKSHSDDCSTSISSIYYSTESNQTTIVHSLSDTDHDYLSNDIHF